MVEFLNEKTKLFGFKIMIIASTFMLAAGLFVEAAVVGAVCVVFLILFVVAGIKQILKDDGRD